MIGIDKIAYTSKIAKIDPFQKFLFSIIPLLLCICLNSITLSILTIFIMGYASFKLGGISYKTFSALLLIPLAFLIFGSFTVMINQFPKDYNVLFGIKVGNYMYGVSSGSFLNGLNIIFKALAAVSCMYFFSLNTNMNSFFIMLRKTKLPILFIEIMELMYRFIFIIFEEGQRIYIAQNSRLGYVGFKNKLKSTADLVSTVFISAFKKVDRINSALESRGFNGSLDSLEESYEKDKKFNIYTILVCTLLIVAYILERIVK